MYVRVYTCMYVYVLHMYMCVFMCILIFMCGCTCICVHFSCTRDLTGDPYPIRICSHCGPDTLAISRPIHGMIRRSVLVRVVKNRWWFRSKTTLFHVSVCSYIISLFIGFSRIYMLLISFHVTIWLIFYQYDYLHHFIRHQWVFTLFI